MLGLLGFRTQNMDGRSGSRVASAYFTALNPLDTSWTVPATGYYTFTLRGGGGGSNVAGGQGASAAAAQVTALVFSGQVVLCTIGRGAPAEGKDGEDTVITLPSGKVITAGSTTGNGLVPGVAAGGDLNESGLTSGFTPTIGNFGQALTARTPNYPGTYGPGSGGSTVSGAPVSGAGGPGILYIQFGRP